MIIKLEWDSNHFGFNVGKVENADSSDIVNIVNSGKTNNFKLIYIFNNSKDLNDLESNEIFTLKLVDTKLTFKKIIANQSKFIFSDENFEENEINSLISLGLQSGEYSRFKIDERISSKKFVELYKTWVINSINKSIADKIITYRLDNKIVGFVSIKLFEDFSKIGLIAVDDLFRGKGIGKMLIDNTENYSYSMGVSKIFVDTQDSNLIAKNFYFSNGFEIEEVKLIYHLWINN